MSGPAHNVIQLRKVRRRRAEGQRLCDAGFHQWRVLVGVRFDVKQGKLLNRERCTRCGEERVRLS